MIKTLLLPLRPLPAPWAWSYRPVSPMVLYAVLAGVSIGRLFLAGFGPGILMGLSMMAVVYFISKREGYVGTGKFSFRDLLVSFKDSFFALLMPIIILGGIYGGIFTPTEAAAVAVVYGGHSGLFRLPGTQNQGYSRYPL